MSAGPATLKLQTSGDETIEGFALTETYEVFTTDSSDGPLEVLNAPGLPVFGAGSSFDALSRALSRRPIRQNDSTNHWLVEVTYSRETGTSQQDKQNPPTLRPVKRSAKVRWVEEAVMEDLDGNPILTSAKTPFNPPMTMAVPHLVLSFQRWESSFNSSTITQYVGAVNSTTFGGRAPSRVLCTNIEASEEWEQDGDGNLQRYWLATYEFEVKDGFFSGWNPVRVLDADFWFIDPGDNKRKPIFVDVNGNYHGDPADANGATPVPSPVPLSGVPGSVGDVLQPAELPGSAHYLEFDMYYEADFNALGLPLY
jgi:hypothetical protein